MPEPLRQHSAHDRTSFSGKPTPGKKPEAVVLGAGVVGLTTALEAQRAGFRVRVVSDRDPLQTTSAKAGAVFEPYKPGNMSEAEMKDWVEVGLDEYGRMIDRHPESVTGMRHHDLYSTSTGIIDTSEMPFLEVMPHRLITGADVPGGGHYQSGVVLEGVPMINPLQTLPFLVEEFVRGGGEIKTDIPTVTDFAEFVKQTPETVIFNCTGLGARELVADPELEPVRGQIVVARGMITEPALGGVNSILGSDVTYIFPRGDNTTVLGGTLETGEGAEVTTEPAIRRIVERVKEVIPGFDPGHDILYTYAGLRPFRESGAVVDFGKFDGARWGGRPVKHVDNFGHGGSGWTFGPGAAKKAVQLATGDRQE